MRKISLSLLFVILIGVISVVTGCGNENKRALKNEVLALNAQCPVNLGMVGDMISVNYDENDNTVTFYYAINEKIGSIYFLEENRENMMQQLKLVFSSTEGQEMLKPILNAQANLKMIFKSPGGKTAELFMNYDELSQTRFTAISEQEIPELKVENSALIANSACPVEIDEMTVMTGVRLDKESNPKYMVYDYELDDSGIDMKMVKNNPKLLRDVVVDNMKELKHSPAMRNELLSVVEAGYGYKYIYTGKKSKEKVEIAFTPEEFKKMMDN